MNRSCFPGESYKLANGLTLPINLARNIGRKAAVSHFIFSVDSGWLPSPGLASGFLQMMQRHGVEGDTLRVFVVPSFKIKFGYPFPQNKAEFISLLEANVITHSKSSK